VTDKRKYMKRSGTLMLILMITFISAGCSSQKEDIFEKYYNRLDKIREQKSQELVSYMKNVNDTAVSVKDDQVMTELFQKKYSIYKKRNNGEYLKEDFPVLYELRNEIENRYIDKYLIFNDILFIHKSGEIFYTVKRGEDYHKNIFEGELAETKLADAVKKSSSGRFVDYDEYMAQDEPSAFFVEPVSVNGEHKGWFAFSYTVNRVNDIFIKDDLLGSTGEVFLVNKEAFMLTDSKFNAESTILRQHLSPDNISAKFQEKKGHKEVVDYMGHRAVTSFEVIDLFGSEWLLIAKIDRDEVVTASYREKSGEFWPKIADIINSTDFQYPQSEFNADTKNSVDMDEFKRVTHGEPLYTHGVSYCTVVIITLKDDFSYMGHLSAYDVIYRGTQTDILRRMLGRIEKFDLLDYRKRDISVHIVSQQIRFAEDIAKTFADWGLMLSQIKIAANSKAKYANIYHKNGETDIRWFYGAGGKPLDTSVRQMPTVQEIYEDIILSE